MTPLRVGMIGCGAIATACHLPALKRLPDVTLAVVVDRDADWARRVAREFGAAHVRCPGEPLRGLIDAAIVATPNATHAAVAGALVEQGIHVLCEKPLCTTVADARRLLSSPPAGGRVMPAHVRRFQDNLRVARELVEDGVIGDVRRLKVSQSSRKGSWDSRTAYRDDRTLAGGGVLIELGVHLLDIALWFLGREIGGVESTLMAARTPELESDAHVRLHFAGGAVAEVSASDRVALPRALTIEGSEGWLSLGLDEDQPVEFFSGRAPVCRVDGAQRLRPQAIDPFERQLQEFAACVGSQTAFPVPDADVLAGLEVIERVYAERREAA